MSNLPSPATPPAEPSANGLSRRSLLTSTASAVALTPLAAVAAPTANDPARHLSNADGMPVRLTVNGQQRQLVLDPRTTLLDALRDHLGLMGTKKGCDHGQCGACTVLIDGRRVLSCLTLAVAVRGQAMTIEGLARPDGTLHPMQQAFIDQDGFQCGYCTPGQILSAVGCVGEGHAGSDDEIREYMSGNLCRCAAYPHIVKAINQAKLQMGS
jgi:xanthine dehydrogenase YagT iron-sulfur-binding subunit